MEKHTMQTIKESDLVTGLKGGDQKTFHYAVRKYSPGMLAVARYYS